MTSKTSWDNGKNVFLWQLRRALPLAALCGAALLGIFLWSLRRGILWPPAVMAAGIAFLLPPLFYDTCFSRSKADLFCALPVSREKYFRGSFLAALACLEVPLLAAGAVQLFLTWGGGHFHWFGLFPQFTGTQALWALGIAALLGACNLAFFTLAAVSGGTYLSYGVNSLLLSVAWPLLTATFLFLVRDVIPGADNLIYAFSGFNAFLDTIPALLSPVCAALLYFPGHRLMGDIPWWLLLCWLALAALLLFLGERVFVRRPSEAAGSSRMDQSVEFILQTVLGAGAALGTGSLFPNLLPLYLLPQWLSILLTLLGMAAALGMCWLLTGLLFHHRLRRPGKKLPDPTGKRLPALAASGALALALTAVVSTGMGLDTFLPARSNISGAWVKTGFEDYAPTSVPVVPQKPGEAEKQGSRELWAALSSEEALDTLAELQSTWGEAERRNQFPYLPGRQRMGLVRQSYLSFAYHLKDGPDVYHSFYGSGNIPDRAKPLADECWELADRLQYSEEYVNGIFPYCAIDAAEKIGKTETVWIPSEYYKDPSGEYGYYEVEPSKAPKEIGSLPNPVSFRKELEAALFHDFTQGRWPIHGNTSGEPAQEPVYEIVYSSEKEFTARGGMLRDYSSQNWPLLTPAEGETFRLANESVSFMVWPEMTETYALLEQQYS